MSLRLAAGQAKYALVTALAVAGVDWRFRFVIAPFVLICALLLASVAEAYTAHCCCDGDNGFDFKRTTREKLEIMAMVLAAMAMDTGMWVLSRAGEDLFPVMGQVNIPLITIVWTIWLIYAEGNRTRKNVMKSRGKDYGAPFPATARELAAALIKADTPPAGRPRPRRRKTDEIIAEVAKEEPDPRGESP